MDLNRIDLNLLVAFDALMSERSVTAAAERLSVGQSAMSSTLARLRKLLDDPVLVREGRTMVATPTAEALAERVQQILADIQSMLSERRSFDPATDHQTFKLAASNYVTLLVLHPLLVMLETEAPHIRLHIQPVTINVEEQLFLNKIDLAIIPQGYFPARPEIPQEVLYADDFVVAVDRLHPEVGDTISMEQFSSLPYLVGSADSANSRSHERSAPVVRTLAETQLDMLGISRRMEVVSNYELAPFLLRDTRLIALLPRLYAEKIAHIANIRLLEPPMSLNPLIESMMWTRQAHDDPAHQWLRSRLYDLAHRLVTGDGKPATGLAET